MRGWVWVFAVLWGVAPAGALAGKVPRAIGGAFSPTYDAVGVRTVSDADASKELAAGESVTAEVVTGARLAAFGLKDLAPGDKLTITCLEVDTRFRITAAGKPAIELVVDPATGALKLAPPVITPGKGR